MKFNARIIFMLLMLMLALTVTSTAMAAEVEQRSEFQAPIMIVNTSFLNVRTGPGAQYSILITVVGGTEFPVLGMARDRVWYQVSTVAGVGWINSQFVLPRGNFGNVPIISLEEALEAASHLTTDEFLTTASTDSFGQSGFVAGREWGISVIEDHALRTQPSTGAQSFALAGANDVIYTLLEATSNEGRVWYRIRLADNVEGWVEADKTRFRPFACDYTAVIFSKEMAPGLGPDGSGTLEGNMPVPGGTEAYLLDAVRELYKIELIDGNVGWVEAGSVTIRGDTFSEFCATGGLRTSGGVTATGTTTPRPLFTSPIAIINTGFLNLRSGPGAQYTVVTTLAGGTEVTLVGLAPDRVWYLVEGNFGQAWLNSEFVLFRGDGSRLPIIREVTGSILARPTATVTNAINLYAAPDLTLGLIGALSGPLELNIVARTEDFDWVQLETDLGFGWVRVTDVVLHGDTTLVPIVR